MADFHPSHGTVRFGVFELDFRASELRKQGTKAKLQEQPFQILQVLLQRPGEIVTREELQQKIWPCRFRPWALQRDQAAAGGFG